MSIGLIVILGLFSRQAFFLFNRNEMYHEFMPIFLISNLVIHTDVSKFKYGIAVFLHLISFDFYICISLLKILVPRITYVLYTNTVQK